jgi:crotonobetainyl-CoA:carnitine CoA-transferase CaiB-like acyl-CoA transferase
MLDPEEGPPGLRQTAFPHPADGPPSLAPPPHYAEHTAAILRDRLGYSANEVRTLSSREVIRVR